MLLYYYIITFTDVSAYLLGRFKMSIYRFAKKHSHKNDSACDDELQVYYAVPEKDFSKVFGGRNNCEHSGKTFKCFASVYVILMVCTLVSVVSATSLVSNMSIWLLLAAWLSLMAVLYLVFRHFYYKNLDSKVWTDFYSHDYVKIASHLDGSGLACSVPDKSKYIDRKPVRIYMLSDLKEEVNLHNCFDDFDFGRNSDWSEEYEEDIEYTEFDLLQKLDPDFNWRDGFRRHCEVTLRYRDEVIQRHEENVRQQEEDRQLRYKAERLRMVLAEAESSRKDYYWAALEDNVIELAKKEGYSWYEAQSCLREMLTYNSSDQDLKEIVDAFVTHAIKAELSLKDAYADARYAAESALPMIVRRIEQDKIEQEQEANRVRMEQKMLRDTYRATANPTKFLIEDAGSMEKP